MSSLAGDRQRTEQEQLKGECRSSTKGRGRERSAGQRQGALQGPAASKREPNGVQRGG
jgi:hypothetical protein